MTETTTPTRAQMREMADKVAGACPRRGQAGHVCGDCLCSHAAVMLRSAASALDAKGETTGTCKEVLQVAAPPLAPSSEPKCATCRDLGYLVMEGGYASPCSCRDTRHAAPREPQPSSELCGCGHSIDHHSGHIGLCRIPGCECDEFHAPSSSSEASAPQTEETVTGETSDGYHTFNELYAYRKGYNALLFNEWAARGLYDVHKSWTHSDGEPCFGGGWFIVVAETPSGQISNHYKAHDWDLFQIPERERGNPYDGHTPQIALERVLTIAAKPREPREPHAALVKEIDELIAVMQKDAEAQ